MTIGRLKSAASSVAVPLAMSVTSQAASASCERPSSSSTVTRSAYCRRSGSIRWRSPGTTGRMKRRPLRSPAISAAAANRRGAMYWISERRLPGSKATTLSSPRPSAARASVRGTSSGIVSASGCPT